jgi:phosphohistidine phosphatase
MRLYLMRHGEAAGGRLDPGLTEAGAGTIRRMSTHLARIAEPTAIRHSVKRRARETAEILAGGLGVPLEEAKGLSPQDAEEPVAEELAFETDDLLIVSHLPFIDRLLTALVFPRGGGDRFVLNPGSVLGLERADLRPGHAIWWVRWFVTPEVMPPI